MKKCCIALIGMLGFSTLNAVCKDLMCDPLARIYFKRFTETGELRADKGPLAIAISDMDIAAMIEKVLIYKFPDPSQQKTISCDALGTTVLGHLVDQNPKPFQEVRNLRINLCVTLDPTVYLGKTIKLRLYAMQFPALSQIADKFKDLDFGFRTINTKAADFIETAFAARLENFRFTLSSFYDNISNERVLNILQKYSNVGALKLYGVPKKFIVSLKKKLRLNGEVSLETNEITINNYFFNWDEAADIRTELNCLPGSLRVIQLHWYRIAN